MDVLKLFYVEPKLGVGMPLLITAITKSQFNEWRGELFVLLQDEQCSFLDVAVTVNSNNLPVNAPISVDQSFLEQELLQQANWRLRLHLEESGYYKRFGGFFQPIEFVETNVNALAAFWMRDKCRSVLAKVRDRTKSKSLENQIDLVRTLPHFLNDPAG